MSTIHLNALFMRLLKGDFRFEHDGRRFSTGCIELPSLRAAGNHGGLPVAGHRIARDSNEIIDGRTVAFVDDFFHVMEDIVQEVSFGFGAKVI